MNFLGSTTPADLLASVTTGVQTTGTSLWPLFTVVGVGLAYLIGMYVISFIHGSIGNPKNLPGLPGYDSKRGSGESAGNVALTDKNQGGHMKAYEF